MTGAGAAGEGAPAPERSAEGGPSGTGEAATLLRVVVVDDQQVVREGLIALLEIAAGVRVAGSAADGEQAVQLVAEVVPDVVLMDLRMPVLDGVDATRRIAAAHPDVAVVVLTTYVDDASIAGALRAGARGYLTKDAGRAEIVAALRAAAVGQATFDTTVSSRMAAAFGSSLGPDPNNSDAGPDAGSGTPSTGGAVAGSALAARAGAGPDARAAYPDGLTAREVEILALIVRGLTNAEIAETLFIGASTVKTHINNAFAKIGARGRADAVRYAYEHGLTPPQ